MRETAAAVLDGVDEVDLVYPYRALLAGDAERGREMVAACKAACGERVLLKVILETGELGDPALIRQASRDAIAAGADFIKTSTGKVAVNATPEAAALMLGAIRETGGRVGFKPAGAFVPWPMRAATSSWRPVSWGWTGWMPGTCASAPPACSATCCGCSARPSRCRAEGY